MAPGCVGVPECVGIEVEEGIGQLNSPAIPILHQHHVSISVPDLEEAISWYGQILGFAVHSRFTIEAISAQAAFLKREANWIELWQVGAGAQVPELRRNPDTEL